MLNLVSTAETAYWDVVSARENLKVAEGARDVAAEFLKLSQKQLELGALSPLDIYNPQQQLATQRSAAWRRPSSPWRSGKMRCASRSAPIWIRRSAQLPIVLTDIGGDAAGIDQLSIARQIDRAGDAESPRSQSRRRRTWTWTIFRSSSRAMPCCRTGADRQLHHQRARRRILAAYQRVQRGRSVPGADLDSRRLGDALEPDVRLRLLRRTSWGCASSLPIRNRAPLPPTWPTRSCARSRTR